jgi:hypothetical protein
MAPTPLTPLQLQKAQAEAEGYQNGPLPPLNLPNQYTQAVLGNPQLPETGPVPAYPGVRDTPNALLRVDGMSAEQAQNLLMLDQDLGSDPLAPYSFFKSAGHQQPAIAAVAYEPCVTTANHVNAHLFYLSSSVLVNVISVYVGVGAAGATANFGIYNQDGSLRIDSGPMAVTGSGVVVFAANTAINVGMVPGWYYFAFSCTSTAATFLAIDQNNIIAYYALSGGTPKNVLAASPLAGGALPLTLGNISTLSPSDVVYHPMVIFDENI